MVVPGMKKDGVIVGGSFGRGTVSCRTNDEGVRERMFELGGESGIRTRVQRRPASSTRGAHLLETSLQPKGRAKRGILVGATGFALAGVLRSSASHELETSRRPKGRAKRGILVGATGFEPATSRSQTERSTRLSHAPTLPTILPRLPDADRCPRLKFQRAGRFSPRNRMMLFLIEARPTARRPSGAKAPPQICWPSAGKCVSWRAAPPSSGWIQMSMGVGR